MKATLKEIKTANDAIEKFCKKFSCILTITNAKGIWIARMTRKSVQIFISTGETALDAIINASDKCLEKDKA